MNKNIKGTLAIVAAFFVLFSVMFDPKISVFMVIVMLVGFGTYSFIKTTKN